MSKHNTGEAVSHGFTFARLLCLFGSPRGRLFALQKGQKGNGEIYLISSVFRHLSFCSEAKAPTPKNL